MVSVRRVSRHFSAATAGWLEKGIYLIGPRYDGMLPACEAGLDVIAQRFAQKEGRFWNSDLTDSGVRQRPGNRLPALGAGNFPRRYCTAVAQVSDGRQHTVHYSIVEDGGMIGMFWGVEWCVVGSIATGRITRRAKWRVLSKSTFIDHGLSFFVLEAF